MPAALSPASMRTPTEAPRLQPREELAPAFGGLGEPLGGTDDLAVVVVVVHSDGHHDGDILVGAFPASLEVYPVDAGVGVGALEESVAPCLHGLEGLLVGVRYGRGGHRRPPQDLAHALDPAGRDAREARLDHGLLDRGLSTPVALDYRRGEPHALGLGLGHAHRDSAGRRRGPPLVVPGATGLPSCRPLVALSTDEVVGLLVEKAVRHLLDGPPDELARISPQ